MPVSGAGSLDYKRGWRY